MRYFDFQEQLEFSQGISKEKSFKEILLKQIPGAKDIKKTDLSTDIEGTDYNIIRENGRMLSVDVKVRKLDYKKRGEDDLALETWSVVGQTVGWTRDNKKNTDYIFWYWDETKRWCLIPFVYLYTLFSENWEDWLLKFKNSRQQNEGYESECIFVPRKFLWQEIYKRFGGG